VKCVKEDTPISSPNHSAPKGLEEAEGGATSTMGEDLQELCVNGKKHHIRIKPHWTLAYVLREKLGLTGVKVACDHGACGACTVLMDSDPILSCMTLAVECKGKNILTVEGLSDGINLHPIQEAWLEMHGTQCGFCAPGMILTAKALLDKNPRLTREEAREGLSGNLCRCGNYDHILEAVMAAEKKIEESKHE
jgi:aerobic-type carbon monoxide dehydrogenase small subunit (CoxS/CutS family)